MRPQTLRRWLIEAPELGDEMLAMRQNARVPGFPVLESDGLYIRWGDVTVMLMQAVYTPVGARSPQEPDHEETLRLARLVDERLAPLIGR
jgi:hypothetical protein